MTTCFSFLTSEETVLQCLGFIEKSLQRPDAPCSAADYFSSGYSFKLASILLSIRLSKFSKYYARKVLQIFSCLLSSCKFIVLFEVFSVPAAG